MGGLGSWFRNLFGGGGVVRSADGGIYVRVKCDACGEIIQTRINPNSELSQQDDGSYFVRKVLVGKQCFRPIEVLVNYSDLGRHETSREVHGGVSVE